MSSMLIHIEETECPYCGAEVKQESVSKPNECGCKNERRVFWCGCELIHYFNSYSDQAKTESSIDCPKHPAVIKHKEDNNKIIGLLREHLKEIDGDETIKDDIDFNLKMMRK